MKPNELRIGNLVNFASENTIFEITEVGKTGLGVKNAEEETWIELDSFEPIPIAEDWLFRLGFNHKGVANCGQDKFYTQVPYSSRELRISVETNTSGTYDFMFKNPSRFVRGIKYVHELQNLYFTICNEELELEVPHEQ